MDTIPMTTTDLLSEEELDRLLAEDSPRGRRVRRLLEFVRTRIFGLEPLCPQCETETDPAEAADVKVRRLTHEERVAFCDAVLAEGIFPDATVEQSPLYIAEREDGEVGYGLTPEEARKEAAAFDAPVGESEPPKD